MNTKTSNVNLQRLRSSSLAVAVGIVCSSPSLAEQTLHGPGSLTSLLPKTFSRIDYVATAPALDATEYAGLTSLGELNQFSFIQPLKAEPKQTRSRTTYAQRYDLPDSPNAKTANQQPKKPAKTRPTDNTRADEYAQQDLDLALENFFYALEDLIQSASRNAALNSNQGDTYVAQVQFPAQVMTSLSTANPRTVQSAPTAVASATANARTNAPINLPPARTSVDKVKPSAFAFLDDFKFTSQLTADIEFNDNIYTTRNDRQSDFIARTLAKGSLESRSRKSSLKFEGDFRAGQYRERSDDNYFDYNAVASYSTLLSERSKAFVGLGYFVHHEDRGEGSTDGDLNFDSLIGEPVEFESYVMKGIYERGTKRTRGRLVGEVNLDQLRAKNFRDQDAITNRDRDLASFTGTAFYNWSQRMSFLLELRHQDISYVDTANIADSLDSTQTRYALGAEWLATRKTAGQLRIGLQEKDFAAAETSDFRNLSWEAVVEWTPKPRTEFVIETQADTAESDGFGSARDNRVHKITWKQKWTPRITSGMSLQTGDTDYREQERFDTSSVANAGVSYSINSSTNASVKLTYLDNSSNLDEFDFDRTTIQVGLDMEL